MTDSLTRARLSLREATRNQEGIMTVSEAKSSTEKETGQVKMLQYLRAWKKASIATMVEKNFGHH